MFILLLPTTLRADETGDPVALSDSIGPEIDAAERTAYRLFPDVDGFRSAVVHRTGQDRYRVRYSWEDDDGAHSRSLNLPPEALEATRLHVLLTEEYWTTQRDAGASPVSESELIRRLALRQAAKRRYDVAAGLLEELRETDVAGETGAWAGDVGPRIDALRNSRRALLWPGSLIDQRGRTRLLIFSGYYGVWLGIATPIALDAKTPEAFSLGLLLGAPAAILTTHWLTKGAEMSVGRTTIIRLGGHLGTWQGLGWTASENAETPTVVGVGEVAGLAGIAGAVLLTRQYEFAPGHASLTSSGLFWGAWFGLVAGVIADQEDKDLLPPMLIGSDVMVLVAGIATRNMQISERRVSLLNLSGVMGAAFGFGIDLLADIQDENAVMGIAAAGSVVGYAAGLSLTRNFDQGRDLSLEGGGSQHLGRAGMPSIEGPRLALRRTASDPRSLTPTVELEVRF